MTDQAQPLNSPVMFIQDLSAEGDFVDFSPHPVPSSTPDREQMIPDPKDSSAMESAQSSAETGSQGESSQTMDELRGPTQLELDYLEAQSQKTLSDLEKSSQSEAPAKSAPAVKASMPPKVSAQSMQTS